MISQATMSKTFVVVPAACLCVENEHLKRVYNNYWEYDDACVWICCFLLVRCSLGEVVSMLLNRCWLS